MEEKLVLEAKHLFTIYRNEDNGYTVAKFVTYDSKEEEFTATGIFKELVEEERYRLKGEYKEHARYGMQFQVFGYEKMIPNDESSLIRYFSSSKTDCGCVRRGCFGKNKSRYSCFGSSASNERKKTQCDYARNQRSWRFR